MSRRQSGDIPSFLLQREAEKLTEAHALSRDAATWAVSVWATALNIVQGSNTTGQGDAQHEARPDREVRKFVERALEKLSLSSLEEKLTQDNPKVCVALTQAMKEADSEVRRNVLQKSVERNLPNLTGSALEAGADPNVKNRLDETPLHQAALLNEPQVARALLGAGADPNARDDYLGTPLHSAARGNAPLVAEALLMAGADPNLKDKFGNTPFHETASHNSLEVAELLSEFGADPRLENNEGQTPLSLAGHHSRDSFIPLFESQL